MFVSLDLDEPDSERRERLFRGEFLTFSRRQSTAALIDHARSLIEAALGTDPERAQLSLPVEAFVERIAALKTHFTNDSKTKALVVDVLREFGCDTQATCFDVPRLRVVSFGGYLSSGVGYAYRPHRDTWYASPSCQVNWWLPVFEAPPERAMSFYPGRWDRAVANNSAAFDYPEWCRVDRAQATSQIGEDTRRHPLPEEDLSAEAEARVALGPGSLLMFSAAHLHATAPNQTDRTRFSIDFRTVHQDDLEQGRGAPNVDGAATGTTLGDFLDCHTMTPIPEGIGESGAETR